MLYRMKPESACGVRVKVSGGRASSYSHARQGYHACDLMRVARDLVEIERVVKRVAHVPQNTSSSVRLTPPPPHVGALIPPCDDVCAHQ